jgi:septation ring formation regulator EzrA
MTALFIALGIAVITLLALLLWFVPHLFQQQAQRNAKEAAELRNMLLDMLSEQEAVTLRQSQLSSAIAALQRQIEHVVSATPRDQAHAEPTVDPSALRQLEERIGAMQTQIQSWLDVRNRVQRNAGLNDNEAWANLLSLLAAIQDRVGQLSVERTSASVGLHARVLLEELESEMQQLRSISEDISTLQWRLRRSLHERESNISLLRAQSGSGAD